MPVVAPILTDPMTAADAVTTLNYTALSLSSTGADSFFIGMLAYKPQNATPVSWSMSALDVGNIEILTTARDENIDVYYSIFKVYDHHLTAGKISFNFNQTVDACLAVQPFSGVAPERTDSVIIEAVRGTTADTSASPPKQYIPFDREDACLLLVMDNPSWGPTFINCTNYATFRDFTATPFSIDFGLANVNSTNTTGRREKPSISGLGSSQWTCFYITIRSRDLNQTHEYSNGKELAEEREKHIKRLAAEAEKTDEEREAEEAAEAEKLEAKEVTFEQEVEAVEAELRAQEENRLNSYVDTVERIHNEISRQRAEEARQQQEAIDEFNRQVEEQRQLENQLLEEYNKAEEKRIARERRAEQERIARMVGRSKLLSILRNR